MGNDVARGGDLFRLNCASCHNFTGKGGALSSGKYAPELEPAEPAQIYTAMLTGPQNMPKFSDRQLSPDEKRDIVAYVREAADAPNPGGYGLGGFGPAPEGMAMWIIGMVAVIGVACGSERGHERHRRHQGHGRPGPAGVPGQPSDAELASMSREQLVELGGKLDGVETVFKEDRWPVPGTKAEKRAERAVAYWLLLGGFSGLALLLVFLFWPWEYKPLGSEGELFYDAGHPAVRPDVRAVDPRDRHRRGAVPEEVHPRGDLDPGPPRRRAPPRSTARPSRPTSPTRWRPQRSSGAS